eukprot:TRINITY_DN5461_c0_g2_i1.p1 TRINITY_DN5461_c0_g2~~TRINITY_DN5461_c0_g2_i1.p1  ORF type:complete len:287 (-),score=96.51 TRINITY_DN5461_c0_g2_i1:321-1127(-)
MLHFRNSSGKLGLAMASNERDDGWGDDDDDYMSKKYIDEEKASTTEKRKKELQEDPRNKKMKMKDRRQQEEIKAREEGLNRKIDEDNKGFKMLKMMGYKPGQGLGKEESGRAEPIPINIPAGRTGLGKAAQLLEQRQKKAKEELVTAASFQQRMKEKYGNKKAYGQWKQCLYLCEQMDREKGKTEESKFSPYFFLPSEEERNEELEKKVLELPDTYIEHLELPVTERTLQLVQYMKTEHTYCFYCGQQYPSLEELQKKCPGDTEEDHD